MLSRALFHLLTAQLSEAGKGYYAHFIVRHRKMNCLLEPLGNHEASRALVLFVIYSCLCGGILVGNAVVLGRAGAFRISPHPGSFPVSTGLTVSVLCR